MNNENQIDLYLFSEMPEAEREKFEDRFVDDEDLFYEIVSRENDLVDRYVAGSLQTSERDRFVRSLANDPARRQKVENSKLLHNLIAEQRTDANTITGVEDGGLFSKFAALFALKPMQFATAGLVVLFALWSTYLLIDNRRLSSLDQELAAARSREAELGKQIENEQEAAGDLTADLDKERGRIAELEAEIARLRRSSGPNVQTPQVSPPTIATLVLTSAGLRGPQVAPRLELAPSVTRVSTVVSLPQEAGERVSVRLNGDPLADEVRVRSRDGEKVVSVLVPVTKLKAGTNKIEVFGAEGAKLVERSFSVFRADNK